MGRPSKFSPELAQIVLASVEKGNFVQTAAALAGIDRSTLKRWLARGQSKDPADAEYRAFRAALRRARAQAEADAVERIVAHRTESADKWFLERSFRGRWAPKIEVTGARGRPLIPADAQRKMLADPRALELACQLDALLASPDPPPDPDPGRVRPPGVGGPLGLPAPPGAPEPAPGPDPGRDVSAADRLDAPEAWEE